MYAALLLLSRKAILREEPTTLSRALAFLHEDYKPHFFYWELVEVLRRFVLCGVAVLVHPGSIVQLDGYSAAAAVGVCCAAGKYLALFERPLLALGAFREARTRESRGGRAGGEWGGCPSGVPRTFLNTTP